MRTVACIIGVALALAGCANFPSQVVPRSACVHGEASYDCQLQRYFDVSAP